MLGFGAMVAFETLAAKTVDGQIAHDAKHVACRFRRCEVAFEHLHESVLDHVFGPGATAKEFCRQAHQRLAVSVVGAHQRVEARVSAPRVAPTHGEPSRAGWLIAGRKSILFDIPGNKGTRRITQTILIAT